MYTHCNLHGYRFKIPKLQSELIEELDFGPNIHNSNSWPFIEYLMNQLGAQQVVCWCVH